MPAIKEIVQFMTVEVTRRVKRLIWDTPVFPSVDVKLDSIEVEKLPFALKEFYKISTLDATK